MRSMLEQLRLAQGLDYAIQALKTDAWKMRGENYHQVKMLMRGGGGLLTIVERSPRIVYLTFSQSSS